MKKDKRPKKSQQNKGKQKTITRLAAEQDGRMKFCFDPNEMF
jgi:hypothetical protein